MPNETSLNKETELDRLRGDVSSEPDDSRYRLLVECSPYCIHQIDPDGRLRSMNAAGLRMMGVETEDEIVGTPYLDAVAEKDRDRVGALMAAALRGEASKFEFEAINGRLFASSFAPLYDAEGRLSALMGLTQDITETKRAALALAESERRLEVALQGGSLGVWDCDLDTDRVVLGESWLRLFGYRPGALAGDLASVQALVHPEDRERVETEVNDHLRGKSSAIESEHRIRSADGDWRWVVVRGMVVERDPDGRPRRVSGTTLDVSERHRAEQERLELEERLQQAQKMESIGQLAGGIAHDFSNLLQVIIGNVELAQRALAQGESPEAALGDIGEAAKRASDLTGRLLTFSRKQCIRRRPVDLNRLVSGTISMISRVMPETIEIRFREADGELPVRVDASQVEQALLNLCLNARDAMAAGGCLTLTTARYGTRVARIEVADTGCGMPDAVVARAFEPFFTTREQQSGTGLGLSIVYGIAQQNQGSVRIDSEPGIGTRVTLEFPITSEVPADEERQAPRKQARPGGTILVVEDEAMVRQLVARMLQAQGYRVVTAEDGAKGVAAFLRGGIDAVVMDAVMPVMDGREAARRMLRADPNVRLLFTSGYHEAGVLPEEFLERRGLTVLRKPYPAEELTARLRELLDA